MIRLKLLCAAFTIALFAGGAVVHAEDQSSPNEKLSKAIKLYQDRDYEGSRAILLEIKDAKLDGEGAQLQLSRYLAMTGKAIAEAQKAQDALGAGDAALEAGQAEDAKKHYAAVMSNPYAAADVRASAKAKLDSVPAAPAAPVKAETAKAVESTSLVQQLAHEHQLLWQKAVAQYKTTELKIRRAVLGEEFAEARKLMDYAKQTIELNRRYATPANAYDDYVQQARELEAFIDTEKRQYDEEQVKIEQEAIKARRESQLRLVEETKQQQVRNLMDRAAALRKESKLAEAIQVLDQVLAIDPNNNEAAWQRETLEDLLQNRRDFQAVRDRQREAQDLFVEMDESGVPYHGDIMYPKDWPAISAKRLGVASETESPENQDVRRKLGRVAPEIKFDDLPFEEVIDKLRAFTGLNIVPNWAALEAAAIEKDAEVSLRLSNVSFEKALELILDHVGAGEVALSYDIDEGVIQISTKEDLSRRTMTLVYNIKDLLISVPTFKAPGLEISNIGQDSGNQEGGLGGGRFIEGGGGGGGGNNNFLDDEDDDEDEDDDADPVIPIIYLIMTTIDPESWREAGGNVGTIAALNQQLIVTQTATAHAQLRDLLKQLRQARALQIAVEARFISITRNWLEQIGVDLDVVLNNGNAGFDRSSITDPLSGNSVLVPRQFVRNGFTPGAPGGVGLGMPTQPFSQPYGQAGLVPAASGAANNFTPFPMQNNTLDLASPSDTNITGSLGSLVNSTPAFQIFGSFLDNIQVDFLLRASQVDRRASNLDSPRLTLFNGQRASFESFIEQDYIAALTPVIGDNAGAYQPRVLTALTGRALDVQATVSADRRYVTMTVRTFTRTTGDFRTVFFAGSQTVGSGFVELATQETQRIRTTVTVPDGGTLLIGGLKESGERDVDAGVPILSRIPILKRAFSNTSNVKDDAVLLILIKPTIIIQEEAEAEAFPRLSTLGSDGF